MTEVRVFPSGEPYEISRGDLRATIVQISGGLRTFQAGSLEVLDGYPEGEMCHDARGQLLLPWPNRLAGGTYTFEGETYHLPLNEPSMGNAIHGLVRWEQWTAKSHSSDSVTMTYREYPQPGYPFTLDYHVTYTVTEDGLQVNLRSTNVGAEPCPFGAGQHPYLRVGTDLINTALLQIPAATTFRYNEHMIPIGRVSVEETNLDFRELRAIGTTEINADFTDLERDEAGRAHIRLEAPDNGPAVTVWMDAAFKHATVYTGETVQPPSRRRKSVAIEPMTCPPNAFVSGEDLVVLQPGEAWEGNWGLSLSRIS